MRVTAADGLRTIDRALIDPWSSASFVHKQLVQHLCLAHKSKSINVEGIQGSSASTQGSVWFEVSGVKDDSNKLRVYRTYVLKKITRDLPFEPVPPAL